MSPFDSATPPQPSLVSPVWFPLWQPTGVVAVHVSPLFVLLLMQL
jgi:hypothetical protein